MCSASADGGVRLTQKARNAGVTLEPIAAASEIIKIWSLEFPGAAKSSSMTVELATAAPVCRLITLGLVVLHCTVRASTGMLHAPCPVLSFVMGFIDRPRNAER